MKHFYHLHADGYWSPAVRDHFQALRDSGFTGDVFVGLVGTPANRADALDYLHIAWPAGVTVIHETCKAYEQPTLTALRECAANLEPSTPILYAHTKGAARVSWEQAAWRECMTKRVVSDWRACAGLLAGLDAVGPHWTGDCFAGNFWMARAGYLASLPPFKYRKFTPDDPLRVEAETWISANRPRVADVCNSCKLGE